ncbi:MAG: sensor histidine kinase [Actinomycetota bacterium]
MTGIPHQDAQRFSPGVRPRSFTAGAAAAGALVTLTVLVVPGVHFAYRGPELQVALDTAEASIALLVAYLVFGRFRERGMWSDLLLVFGFAVLGSTNLLFAIGPEVVHATGPGLGTWAPLAGRLLGSAAIAAASLPSLRRVARPEAAVVPLVGGVAGSLAVIAASVSALSSRLPEGIEVTLRPEQSGHPHFEGHPALLGAQIMLLLLFGVASMGFTARAEHHQDDLVRWLGAGCALAAFSRLNYFLFPSLYTDYVYTGDLLRLGFYLFILEGAVREIRAYWRSRAIAAVLEERRWLARDLHDGLAQELVFIAGQTRLLQREKAADPRPVLERLAGGVERAVEEARRAIAALTRPIDEPFGRVVAEAAETLGMREDVELRLELEPGVEISPAVREQLLRITREAIANATRHADPRVVTVALSGSGGIRLSVSDDGRGFDPAAEGGCNGFGLTWMRERAEALGGSFRVHSERNKGTTIEVVLP